MSITLPVTSRSPLPPVNPTAGDFWVNTATGRRYVWYVMDNGQSQWVQADVPMTEGTSAYFPGLVGPVGPSLSTTNLTPKITLAAHPPGSPAQGDLWWSTITGQTSVWYFDGNSYQWVICNYGGKQGPEGPPGTIGEVVAGTGLTGGGSAPSVELDVDHTVVAFQTDIAGFAPIASPAFTGTPTAPTPLGTDNSQAIATTAFVRGAIPSIPQTLPPSGPAGGMLNGLYPNPGISSQGIANGWLLTATPGGNAAWAAPPSTAPSGPAGGDLAGTYPNPQIKPSATNGWVLTTVAGAVQWTPLPGSLPPSGLAGGDLNGNYPNPTIRPGSVTGYVLTTVGSVAAWAALPAPPTTLPPSGPAGGDLAGTYPNPTVKASVQLTGTPTLAATPGGGVAANIANVGYVTGQMNGLIAAMPGVIPPGANGQVITTVAGATVWATPAPAASVSVGDTPPASPQPNALWWSSTLGMMFVYYNDGNSTQWVPAAPAANIQTVGWRQLGRIVPAAGQTAADFINIPSDINSLEFQFDVAPAVNAQPFVLQFFDSTGTLITTTYDWAAAMTYHTMTVGAAAQGSASGGTAASFICLHWSNSTRNVSSIQGIRGKGSIPNIRDASRLKGCQFQSDHLADAQDIIVMSSGSGHHWLTGAITGLRFSWGGAAFAAGGAITLWGSP